MRHEKLNIQVLTTMNEASHPNHRSELRDKLETARFEEILYWEGRKEAHFQLIVSLLILILVAVTLQLVFPFVLPDKPTSHPVARQDAPWWEDVFAKPEERAKR